MMGAPTCVDDTSYTSASAAQATAIVEQATVEVAIQTAVALWQRTASQSIAKMQDEIAKEQMKMAEAIAAHAASFWPAIKTFVNNVFSITEKKNEYTSLPTAWGAIQTGSLGAGRQDWVKEQARLLCVPASQCEDIRWLRNAAMMEADMKNFGARQGEGRVKALNDWRFNLQLKALGLGKDVFLGYAAYENVATKASMRVGHMLGSGINATMEAIGYFSAPKPIDYWASGIRKELRSAYAPSSFSEANRIGEGGGSYFNIDRRRVTEGVASGFASSS